MFDDDEWTPIPSITFVTGFVPVIIKCRNHSGGTENIYIHTPRKPNHVLPYEKCNKLCYACINPQTIKTTKASK